MALTGTDGYADGYAYLDVYLDGFSTGKDGGAYGSVYRESPGDYQGTLIVALANQGITDIYFSGGVGSYASTENVPEPSSLALVLGGLGCMVWVGRRRRAK